MNDIINPYGTTTTVPATKGQVDVEISRSIAEVQAMVLMAKKFPRNPIEATERILNECQRQGLAEVALYSYSRGGTDITGPSIRLAETIARNWGNMEAGVRELSQTNGQSEMMSFCWDLEVNVRHSKVFTVKHERHTKKGSYALLDQRDIYEQNSNLAARRLRSVILATVPGDVIEAAVAQCEQTLKASADTSPEAIMKMVAAFQPFNVSREQIEKRIQRRIDSITPAQVVFLRKIYNSLKDGMSTAADWFDITETPPAELVTSGTEAAKQAILKGRRKTEAAISPGPEASPESTAPRMIRCPATNFEESFVLEACADCATQCPDYKAISQGT
jgi:hypothetical protein